MEINVNHSKTYLMMLKQRAMGRLIQLNITTLKLYFDTI